MVAARGYFGDTQAELIANEYLQLGVEMAYGMQTVTGESKPAIELMLKKGLDLSRVGSRFRGAYAHRRRAVVDAYLEATEAMERRGASDDWRWKQVRDIVLADARAVNARLARGDRVVGYDYKTGEFRWRGDGRSKARKGWVSWLLGR